MNTLIVPKKGQRIVTEKMKEEGGLDRDSYRLGKHDGIRDCIHYLKQQGYIVEEHDSEKHR